MKKFEHEFDENPEEYVDNDEYEYYEYDDEEYEEVEVDLSAFPSIPVNPEEIQYGIFITDMVVRCNFARNKSEAEKLISSGLITVNYEDVPSPDCILTEEDFYEGYILVEKYPYEGIYVVLDL